MVKLIAKRTISNIRHNLYNRGSIIQIYNGFNINKRHIHCTKPNQIGEPLIVGVGIAAIAYGAKTIAEAVANRQEQKAQPDSETEKDKKGESFLGSFFQARFYEGGFEEKMTRREAALVLGVRETSEKKKILQAYRKLALLNHPDSGGSTFIAAKINEAKDKMLGGGD